MPLRLFHTADWHLGQTFHGYDRDHEHAAFLDWLLAKLTERRPHALLLAGDVFDTVNPSSLAQRRFYNFLAAAHHALPELQVVITAGNHDAAARLEAPAELFNAFNIRVVGTVPRLSDGSIDYPRFLIPLVGDTHQVEALALAVPFLRPNDVPPLPEASDPYLEGIRHLYHELTRQAVAQRAAHHPGAALVALGHCHLQSARETQDSERRLVIGGAEALRTDTFPADLAYVALGHLHLPQAFEQGRIRYCGSPIPLSFSEVSYTHQILELTFDQGRLLNTEPLAIPRVVPLLRFPEKAASALSDLLPELAKLPPASEVPPALWPYVEINALDDGPDPTRRRKVETSLENKAARLAAFRLHAPSRGEPGSTDPSNAWSQAAPRDAASLQSLDPVALASDYHRQRFQHDADPELLSCLREIILTADTTPTPTDSASPAPSAASPSAPVVNATSSPADAEVSV